MEDEPRILIPYLTALLAEKSRLSTPKASNTAVKGDGAAECGKGIIKIGLHTLLMREQGKTAAQEGAKDASSAPYSQLLLIQGLRGRRIHGVKAAEQGSGMHNFCLYGLIR